MVFLSPVDSPLGNVVSAYRFIVGYFGNAIKWLLPNILNTTATTGDDAPQTRAGSTCWARSFDETAGLVLVETAADGIAVEGMRYSNDIRDDHTTGGELVVPGWIEASRFIMYGGNTITDEADDSVKITYVGDDRGGYIALRAGHALSEDINTIHNFEVTADVKISAGGSAELKVLYSDSIIVGQQISGALGYIRDTDYEKVTLRFTSRTTHPLLLFDNLSAGESVWLKNVSVKSSPPVFTSVKNSLFMVVTGDSIESGVANTDTPYNSQVWSLPQGDINAEIMHRMTLLMGYPITYENHALGGETFDWVATTGLTRIISPPANVLIHCGINDIADSITWASVKASLDTIKATVGDGRGLFIDEILPATTYNDTIAATIRTWNSDLAIWCSNNGAHLILCHDAMGQIRPSTGELDDLLVVYDKDGVHLSQDGVDAMATIRLTALESVLGSPMDSLMNTPLHPTNSEGVYLDHPEHEVNTPYNLDDVIFTSAGKHNYWYTCTSAGTTVGTKPTYPTSGTVVDGTATFTFGGRYNNTGKIPFVLHEPSAENKLWPSEGFVSLTTPSLSVGFYTCSCDGIQGTDSISIAAGTATIAGAGSATPDTDLTFEVTVAGTVSATAVNSPAQADLKAGTVATTHIPTTTAPVTRGATSQTVANPLPVNDYQIRGRAILTSDVTTFLLSLGSPELELLTIGTTLFAQSTGGSIGVALPPFGESVSWGVSYSSIDGLSVSVNGVSGNNSALRLDGANGLTLNIGQRVGGSSPLLGGITDIWVFAGDDPDWYKDTTWSE